jgi:hypothetical protein
MEVFANRTLQTLYNTQEHAIRALNIVVDLLTKEPADESLKKGKNDDFSIENVCVRIKEIEPALSYVSRDHIIELFFKDLSRRVFITGYDSIRYKQIRYTQPPYVLYFGTLERMVGVMLSHGIMSHSKGYIKLYGTPELAAEFAKKFISSPDDRVTVLAINAMEAFSGGLKFSTYKPDEYIVVRVGREYIDRNFQWSAS